MKSKTALVVDDVTFARQVVKEILAQAKITVAGEAANGEEAIKLYRQIKPDFVVMDLVMPKKGGIEASRAIIEQNSDARIIMVSGLSHEQVLIDAVNAGARDFILKPFSAKDLLKSVEKLFENERDA
jgi:two-component system chemotaxis response regulator CheY